MSNNLLASITTSPFKLGQHTLGSWIETTLYDENFRDFLFFENVWSKIDLKTGIQIIFDRLARKLILSTILIWKPKLCDLAILVPIKLLLNSLIHNIQLTAVSFKGFPRYFFKTFSEGVRYSDFETGRRLPNYNSEIYAVWFS